MQKEHARAASASDRPTVYIIDDDTSVLRAMERLLVSAGIRSRAFAGAKEFLEGGTPPDGSCVITDVKMHGMTGPELQRKVRESGAHVSFIFVTACDTEEVRAQAKKDGAVAYFRKPVDDQALLDAIGWAMSHAEENA